MTDLNLSYDYCTGWGNPNEAFFWIAVMQNPYMPEPHCYGASISFQSEDALLLIQRMKGKIGAVAKEEILRIWNEH
jgi:hypothetical protein